jgi:Fe-S-cluster-containing hydrogenase component 2
MLDKFPDVRHSLEATAHQRLAENRSRTIRTEKCSVDQFLAQGLMEAQSLLVLDLERCTRCDQCVRACADAHDGVSRLVREGLRFDKYLVATSCRQCRDPLCMVGCPVGSIRRRNTLEVIIEDWCIGCGLCATNCPYGKINLHPFRWRWMIRRILAGRSRASRSRRRPAISATIMPSPVACTPVRTTPRTG